MHARTLVRFTAALLIVSAVAITVGRMLHPALDHAGMTSAAWAPAHWLWLVGLVTGMGGLTGLYLRQREQVGLLGFLGAAMAWTGMCLMSGAIYFEAVVQPGLIEAQPQLVASFVEYRAMGAYLPVFLASAVAFGVGFLALGIAMFRAGILPKLGDRLNDGRGCHRRPVGAASAGCGLRGDAGARPWHRRLGVRALEERRDRNGRAASRRLCGAARRGATLASTEADGRLLRYVSFAPRIRSSAASPDRLPGWLGSSQL